MAEKEFCAADYDVQQLRARIAQLEQANVMLTSINGDYCKRHLAQLERVGKLETDLRNSAKQVGKQIGEKAALEAENQRLTAGIVERERTCGNLSSRLAGEQIANATLSAENQRLRADAERLDWMNSSCNEAYRERVHTVVVRWKNAKYPDLRSAIDAARGGK